MSSFIGEGEGYPEEGILQVWCSGADMFYRHEDNQGKVVFHKNTNLPQQKHEFHNTDLIEDRSIINNQI